MSNEKKGRLTIRFPEQLIIWVKNQAKGKNRSMNGQIVEIVRKEMEKEELKT